MRARTEQTVSPEPVYSDGEWKFWVGPDWEPENEKLTPQEIREKAEAGRKKLERRRELSKESRSFSRPESSSERGDWYRMTTPLALLAEMGQSKKESAVNVKEESIEVTAMSPGHEAMIIAETPNHLDIPDGIYSLETLSGGNKSTRKYPTGLEWDAPDGIIRLSKKDDAAELLLEHNPEALEEVTIPKLTTTSKNRVDLDRLEEVLERSSARSSIAVFQVKEDPEEWNKYNLYLWNKYRHGDKEVGREYLLARDVPEPWEDEPATTFTVDRMSWLMDQLTHMDAETGNLEVREMMPLKLEVSEEDTDFTYWLAPTMPEDGGLSHPSDGMVHPVTLERLGTGRSRGEFYTHAMPFSVLLDMGEGYDLDVTEDRVKLRGMDASHIEMIDMEFPNALGIPPGRYDSYVEEQSTKTLRKHPEALEWIPETEEIQVVKGDRTASIQLDTEQDMYRDLPDPKIDYQATAVDIDLERLQELAEKAVKDAGENGIVRLSVIQEDTPEPVMSAVAIGDDGEEIDGEPLAGYLGVPLEIRGEVAEPKAVYNAERLERFLDKMLRMGVKEAELRYADDLPMKLEMKTDSGQIKYLIAPYIGM